MELSEGLIPAIVVIVGASLAIVKAVVSLTKSEKDDEVVGKIEKILRPILDAFTGKRVRPVEPAKPAEGEESDGPSA
jgi:hypothetical protein